MRVKWLIIMMMLWLTILFGFGCSTPSLRPTGSSETGMSTDSGSGDASGPDDPTESATLASSPSDATISPATQEISDPQSNAGSTAASSNGNSTSEQGDFDFAPDGAISASGVTKQFSLNMLSAKDDYGRVIDARSGMKTGKSRYTGIFYFTWLGQHGGQQSGIYDITKLLNGFPNELWSTTRNSISPIEQYHFWGEPMFGYYNSMDPWVIRRHIELLTMAGIDFLVFDATNAFEYFDVANVILPILQEYYDKGWNVPKIMYYCNSYSGDVVKHLYEGYPSDPNAKGLKKTGLYKNGLYQDLWFAPNGKPMIIAVTKPDNRSAGWENGNNDLHRVTDPVLLNFFEFKESQWPTCGDDLQDGFPWIDWRRPQLVYNDVINVSVAQHNILPFSDALLDTNLADQMWGRGYSSAFGADHSKTAIRLGLNFEEQWRIALLKDVRYTFITGWNEWTAIKFIGSPSGNMPGNPNRVFFVDTVNEEYSRDVEMMKGGYMDNVYLQMVRNNRTLKYLESTNRTYHSEGSIDIRKGLTQWNNTTAVYYAMTDKGNRNYFNFSRTEKYVDNSLVRDIEEIRVTHDRDNLYFLIKCTQAVQVDLVRENFMNLMIDVEGYETKPFLQYDFLINRKRMNNGTVSVEKYRYERGKPNFEICENASFTAYGNYVQFQIPRSSIGLNGSNFRINFKVADNVSNMLDVSSFYTSGTTVPYGRMGYAYFGE